MFELSKVQLPHVRARGLGQLQTVDTDLAKRVANGLGLDLPAAIPAAKEPIAQGPDRVELRFERLEVQRRSLGGSDQKRVEAMLPYGRK